MLLLRARGSAARWTSRRWASSRSPSTPSPSPSTAARSSASASASAAASVSAACASGGFATAAGCGFALASLGAAWATGHRLTVCEAAPSARSDLEGEGEVLPSGANEGSDSLPLVSKSPPATDTTAVAAKGMTSWQLWWRMLGLLATEWGLVALASAAVILGALTGVAQAGMVGAAFDALGRGGGVESRRAIRQLLMLYVANAGLHFTSNSVLQIAMNRVSAALQMRLFSSVLSQDMDFFSATSRDMPLGVLVIDDVREMVGAMKHLFTTGIEASAHLVGGSIALFSLSKQLSGLAMLCIPVVTAIFHSFASVVKGYSREARLAEGRASAIIDESIANIRVVQSYTGEEQEVERLGETILSGLNLKHQLGMLRSSFFALAGLALNAVTLTVMYNGNSLLSSGVSAGGVKAYLDTTKHTIASVNKLLRLFTEISEGTQAAERIFAVLDSSPEINGVAARGEVPRGTSARAKGELVLGDVSFSYPSRPDVKVLRGVNIRMRPGTTTALVGESGSGKSTVAWLLQRFFDPQNGVLTLDGQNICDMDPAWLRKQIGLVNQEPLLFGFMTVRDNIRYGMPGADDASIKQAALQANCHDFIMALPQGYDTRLQNKGGGLSGGQKQRIAIARALLKDPPILVLDEATSALDGKSEHVVQEALQRLMVGRTTLVIAHRLSSVVKSDNIVVMAAGRVVASGTHQELLAEGGIYAELMQHQQQ